MSSDVPPPMSSVSRSISEPVRGVSDMPASPALNRFASYDQDRIDRELNEGRLLRQASLRVVPARRRPLLRPLQYQDSSDHPGEIRINIDDPGALPDSSQILYRMPSHTLPVAPAIEASPFAAFMSILNDMGFSYEEAEVALVYTKCLSIEEAIDFISNPGDSIMHSYVPRSEPIPEPAAVVPEPSVQSAMYRRAATAVSRLQSRPSTPPESSTQMHSDLIDAQTADRRLPCAICGLSRVFHLVETVHGAAPGSLEAHAVIAESEQSRKQRLEQQVANDELIARQLHEGGEICSEAAAEVSAAAAATAVVQQPAASVWKRHTDERGNPYFYNSSTAETSWELPAGEVPAHESLTREVSVSSSVLSFLQPPQYNNLSSASHSDVEPVQSRDPNIELSAEIQRQMEAADQAATLRRRQLIDSGVELRMCSVCMEEVPAVEFQQYSCQHSYCSSCLRENYRVKINDADIAKLKCIDPKCNRQVEENEVLALLQDEPLLLAKFQKFKRNLEVSKNPNARWCIRPGCDNYMLGSAEKPQLTCNVCQTQVCFSCNQPWHEGLRCDEVIDEQYASWARGRDIQTCPRCNVRIEKDLGCNHMTCQNCKYQFCWLCRGEYSDNHFSEWNPLGCPGAQFAFEDPDSCCRPGRCGGYFLKLWLLFRIPIIAVLIVLAAALTITFSVTLGTIVFTLGFVYMILRTLFWFYCDFCSEYSDCQHFDSCLEAIYIAFLCPCYMLGHEDD